MTFSRSIQLNILVAGNAPLATTLQSSIGLRGATMTLAAPAEVGDSADGVVKIIDTSAGDVSVVSVSPVSALLNGAQAHGAMLDPVGGSDVPQGFDQFFETGVGASAIPYSTTLNVDPGNTGSPIIIPQGSTRVLVKAIRRSGVTSPARSGCEDYCVFAFMPLADTKADMFAPGMSNGSATIFTEGDIDYSVLRSLAPPSAAPDVSTILATDAPSWPFMGWASEDYRLMEVQYALTNSGYSADLAPWRAALAYGAHYNLSNASKRALVHRIVRHGLDIDAAVQSGWGGGRGAGQWHSYHTAHFMTAFLLQDNAMLARAQSLQSNMYTHPRWVHPADEGKAVGFPRPSGQQGRYAATFFADDVGKPWWSETERGSQPTSRYGTISMVTGIIEHFPILLLQNGPGGASGVDAYLNGANNETNDRAAALRLYDRVKGFKNRERGFSAVAPYPINFESFFAAWRSNLPTWGWSGTPDMIDAYLSVDQEFATAIAGGVSWDITGYDFSGNQVITDRRVRYSLDERQWIEVVGQGATGAQTGLLRGVDHYVQIALENASGLGKWSPNYPVAQSPGAFAEGSRNVVQPTGTEAATAPVNTVAPLLVVNAYPAWGGPSWETAPSFLGADQVDLSAGVGYWSGYPAPTFAFQWFRDSVAIPGATSQDYTRVAADAGANLECDVTATNASGSVTVRTTAVTAPAIQTPPAGTLIDTNFTGAFAIDYEANLASVVTSNANAIHRPTEAFNGFEGANVGALQCDKTGSFPSLTLPIGAFTAGTTYRIQAQIVAVGGWLGGIAFGVVRQSDGATYAAGEEIPWTEINETSAIDLDTTLEISGGETDLEAAVRIRGGISAGGTGGGDPYLTYLKISEV